VVAVAEPNAERRLAMAAEHAIPPERAFGEWRELFAAGRMADAVVIATPDREHVAPTLAALDAGQQVLLEKPIAPTAEELRAVADAAAVRPAAVTVAHVLRYTPFFSAVRRIVDEGRLGELVTIHHAENIGYWHFAHSFVRGNWRSQATASPMILAKACHDLDLLRWLAGDRCTAVASFGGLRHFRVEHAPPGAPERCTDGCPAAAGCPFETVRFYIERADTIGWPVTSLCDDPSPAARLTALRTGPFGRCVYRCDNDVVDHQVVALEFANGVRATLAVNGLTADNTRTIKLVGTRGELRGRLDTGEIEVRRFLPAPAGGRPGPWDSDDLGRAAMRDDEREVLHAAPAPSASAQPDDGQPVGDGHGGGDDALMDDFVARLHALRAGDPVAQLESRTSLAASLESHLMAFAAERARLERRVVEL
jgi:predicted dehydrogenase